MRTLDIGSDSRPVTQSLAVHAAVFAGYVCAAIVHTFPLALHPATMFPAGNPDVSDHQIPASPNDTNYPITRLSNDPIGCR